MIYCPDYRDTVEQFSVGMFSKMGNTQCYSTANTKTSVLRESLIESQFRAASEEIWTGKNKNSVGDRACSNDQIIIHLQPKITYTNISYFGNPWEVSDTTPLYAQLARDFPSHIAQIGGAVISVKTGTYWSAINSGYSDFHIGYLNGNTGLIYVFSICPGAPFGYAWFVDKYTKNSPLSYYYESYVSHAKGLFSLLGVKAYNPTTPGYAAIANGCQTQTADPLFIHSQFSWSKVNMGIQGTSFPGVSNTTYDSRSFDESNLYYLKRRIDTALANCQFVASNHEPTKQEWGELASNAINGCTCTTVNSLAYLKDLKSTFSELKEVLSVLKRPTDLKSWSKLWLSFRYGTRLTYSDTIRLTQSAISQIRSLRREQRKAFSWSKSSESKDLASLAPFASTWTREFCYKVYYRPSNIPLDRICKGLFDWGLFPSTRNLWDILPYSFVVDWIVGVEEALKTIDTNLYQEFIDILGVTYSHKDIIQVPVKLSDLGFEDTTATVTLYQRSTAPCLHQYKWTLNWGNLQGINLVDAYALFKAR